MSEIDQSTYFGRVRHFFRVTDMRTLFTTQKQLDAALELLEKEKAGNLQQDVDKKEIDKAHKLKDAIIHPDTGKPIPFPLRMSFQVPSNVGLVVAMLQARSTFGVVTSQFANQTYNVFLNHANRNASNELSNKQLGIAFTGAVTSSVLAAVGLNEVIKRSSLAEITKNALMRFSPFVAVALANACNISLMRWNEMKSGIEVRDKDGNPLGNSPIAGKVAVAQTVLTRILMAVPVMVFPPIVMTKIESTGFFKTRPRLFTPFNAIFVGLGIFMFLPLAMASFPQQSSLGVDKLEPQFQNLVDASGNAITTVYYNKGL